MHSTQLFAGYFALLQRNLPHFAVARIDSDQSAEMLKGKFNPAARNPFCVAHRVFKLRPQYRERRERS